MFFTYCFIPENRKGNKKNPTHITNPQKSWEERRKSQQKSGIQLWQEAPNATEWVLNTCPHRAAKELNQGHVLGGCIAILELFQVSISEFDKHTTRNPIKILPDILYTSIPKWFLQIRSSHPDIPNKGTFQHLVPLWIVEPFHNDSFVHLLANLLN